MAVILGNSAVVNSSSDDLPRSDRAAGAGSLDLMRLNWGPYLWMRCYNNGAQFLDHVVGPRPDWKALEDRGRRVKPGCDGTSLMPFLRSEPSLKLATAPGLSWAPKQPTDRGTLFRASLEALAFLIARGVEEHERSGQHISRITVSGGIARSDLMCEILASVLDRPLERLESDEGPALGAAVTALAAMETHLRRRNQVEVPYTVADAVAQLVRFRAPVQPNAAWIEPYRRLRVEFDKRLTRLQSQRALSAGPTRLATPNKKTAAKRLNGAKRTKATKSRR
jgi:xylulokinase